MDCHSPLTNEKLNGNEGGNCRRSSTSFTVSIDSTRDTGTGADNMSDVIGSVAAAEDEGSAALKNEKICKSDALNEESSTLQEMEPDQTPVHNDHQIVDDLEAVSDISQSESESEPSINQEWTIGARDNPMRRSRNSCSIVSTDHDESLRSLRENVDRITGGRSRTDSRDCMQKTLTPSAAQLLYDQNYYRKSDWLRFVPRKSLGNDSSSKEESNSSLNTGSQSNLSPAPDYRMFDNTRIRMGLNHGKEKTVVRQPEQTHEDKIGKDTQSGSIPETQAENFRLMHPDLDISACIDEEVAADVDGAVALGSNARSKSDDDLPNSPPPTTIVVHPHSDSSQIAFEEEHHDMQDDPGETFQSSLRKGGIIRPHHSAGQNDNINNLSSELSRERVYHLANWDSKYETYACRVDQTQGDRAVEIPIFSTARPHMRAFHYAWLTFFCVFMAWFSIAPLLGEIQDSLGLTKEQIWTSSIASVAGGLVSRVIMGPLCDIYGARWMSAAVLLICGIPTCFTGLVNTSVGLSVLRLVIGIGGSAFVTCQYWTSTMFTREVAGTVSNCITSFDHYFISWHLTFLLKFLSQANALAAGWGNLGGGVTLILTGTILFSFFEWIYRTAGAEDPSSMSWRTCCIIPGLICIILTFVVIRSSDDSPKGNYQKRKRLGLMQTNSAMSHLKSAILDFNTWLFVIQYGCCFGVELTTSNAVALYFKEEFDLSTASAAAVGSVFGFMNIFFRGLGGFLSDVSNAYLQMRGRLIWQHVTFFLEGVFIVVFSKAQSLAGAIVSLIAFSIFVQAAEGSTFGIVPYLNPNLTGTVAGIIGAGGNAGAVVFSAIFRQTDYRTGFFYMGLSTICISVLSNFVWIKGYQGLFLKKRVPSSATTTAN